MGSQRVRHDWATFTHSRVMAHGLSCSVACGLFLDHGSNPCLQPWQILYHWATWEVSFPASVSHLLRALEEGNLMVSLPICFRKIASHCLWPEVLPSCSVSLSLSSFTCWVNIIKQSLDMYLRTSSTSFLGWSHAWPSTFSAPFS